MDIQWEEIDRHLSCSEVFAAVCLYVKTYGGGITEAKSTIGNRFREHYPELYASYSNLNEDD